MGATAAAAILIRKEREMVAAFRGCGATSPGSAVSLDSLNLHNGVAFARLRAHAVIRSARDGTFYLDEESWEATNRLRRRILLLVLALVLVLMISGVITFTLH